MEQDYTPTALEQLVAAASGNASTEFRGLTVQRVVRLPLHTGAGIDAARTLTGFSRNTILSEIIDIGLEAFVSRLSPGVRAKYQKQLSDELSILAPDSVASDLSDFQLEKTS
jgi:hypothetical protein